MHTFPCMPGSCFVVLGSVGTVQACDCVWVYKGRIPAGCDKEQEEVWPRQCSPGGCVCVCASISQLSGVSCVLSHRCWCVLASAAAAEHESSDKKRKQNQCLSKRKGAFCSSPTVGALIPSTPAHCEHPSGTVSPGCPLHLGSCFEQLELKSQSSYRQ